MRFDSQGTGPGSRPEVGGGFVQIGFDPYLRQAGLGWLSLDTYVEYDEIHGLALPPSVAVLAPHRIAATCSTPRSP